MTEADLVAELKRCVVRLDEGQGMRFEVLLSNHAGVYVPSLDPPRAREMYIEQLARGLLPLLDAADPQG
jgi:hypothetical protein